MKKREEIFASFVAASKLSSKIFASLSQIFVAFVFPSLQIDDRPMRRKHPHVEC
jgi:hypothetical protein